MMIDMNTEMTPLMKAIMRLEDVLIKAKRMPIGTVSKGRKKIAEGKWVKVKENKQTVQQKPKNRDEAKEKEKLKNLEIALEDSGFAKEVDYGSNAKTYFKKLNSEIANEINKNILKIYSKDNSIKVNRVRLYPMPSSVPMEVSVMPNIIEGKPPIIDFNINYLYFENKTLSEVKSSLLKQSKNKYFAGDGSISDSIIHEVAHIKMYQDKTWDEIKDLDNIIIKHSDSAQISKYATTDPLEALAEGYVKLSHGEKIPEGIEILIDKYINKFQENAIKWQQ